MPLTVEELLAGGGVQHTVEIPPEVLAPAADAVAEVAAPRAVVLRPLRMQDVQLIARAGRDAQGMTSLLMVQQALVEPKLTVEQVGQMHAGLIEFLVREINRISGLALRGSELEAAVHAPLARACFVLAREFGWTPEQCSELTVGQVLLYLEMLGREEGPPT